ncbi:MAG: Trk system potassium transporter TrkA [Clostridium sp.]
MDIIIIGGGKVGFTLAQHLSHEGDNVTVIDRDSNVINKIADRMDVMVIKGSGTSLNILHEAGIQEADILIAVTNSDEVNMLCCLAAKKLGAKHTVARVRTPEYSEELTMFKDDLGIDLIINPEKEAALEIAQLIKFPSVCSIDSFSKGKVDLIGFTISEDGPLSGKAIKDIDMANSSLLFCAIERDGEVVIPSGDFIFKGNDKIYVIGEHNNIEKFFKKLGKFNKKIKDVTIIGGGRITYYLTKIIDKIGVSTKIIEKDYKKCEALNEILPQSMIINGDGTDHELLLSENFKETGALITLTGSDEENMITSLFALNNNVKNVITKITRVNFKEIAGKVGLETIISPKALTSNKIIKYVRTLKNGRCCSIENIYKIVDNKAEAIEFTVNGGVTFINKPFMEVNFREDVLIAAIVRENNIIIPTGKDYVKLGDKVIIITSMENMIHINDILQEGGKK